MNIYENVQKRLQKLLEVECDEPHDDDESDPDESDHIETEIHERESKQDISEDGQDSSIIDNRLSFIGTNEYLYQFFIVLHCTFFTYRQKWYCLEKVLVLVTNFSNTPRKHYPPWTFPSKKMFERIHQNMRLFYN